MIGTIVIDKSTHIFGYYKQLPEVHTASFRKSENLKFHLGNKN